MKKQFITLGIIGFLLSPVRWTLHGVHIVCEEVGCRALEQELRLEKEFREPYKPIDKAPESK